MACDIAEGKYFIENVETGRYLFQDSEKNIGNCGFETSPVVGADSNYYNLAYWKIIPIGGDMYYIQNAETQQYLFQDGERIQGERGNEGGWKACSGFEAPSTLGTDTNCSNRVNWKIIPQGCDKYFIENVETQRYLFQDGCKIKGMRGDEGGWKASSGFEAPKVQGADANYYNRAYWKLLKQ